MTRSRLESFSDGVLAVAITLLILNISVPAPGSGHLARELGRHWPEYAAYVTSFLTIGIIWINHHVAIARLRAVDHTILLINLLLLMSVVLLPFATNLMATYLRQSSGQHLAAAIYGGSLLLMGVFFALMNRHILFVRPELLAREIPAEHRRQILTRSVGGITPYVLAVALAPVSAYATLIVTSAVAVFYALPAASSAGD
jgi:uncharacterized membrane protein